MGGREGFAKDEVIEFVPSPSGSEYQVNIMDISDSDGAMALLVRGPGSASPGAPALVALAAPAAPFAPLRDPVRPFPACHPAGLAPFSRRHSKEDPCPRPACACMMAI